MRRHAHTGGLRHMTPGCRLLFISYILLIYSLGYLPRLLARHEAEGNVASQGATIGFTLHGIPWIYWARFAVKRSTTSDCAIKGKRLFASAHSKAACASQAAHVTSGLSPHLGSVHVCQNFVLNNGANGHWQTAFQAFMPKVRKSNSHAGVHAGYMQGPEHTEGGQLVGFMRRPPPCTGRRLACARCAVRAQQQPRHAAVRS